MEGRRRDKRQESRSEGRMGVQSASTRSTIAGGGRKPAEAERRYTQGYALGIFEAHHAHRPAAYQHEDELGDAGEDALVRVPANPYEAARPFPYPVLQTHKAAVVVERQAE